ncbi:MAG: phosphotransferase family protein [Chloroflexi bacterium]|nr:MAG: phosphotransferase family protein [Chloroflexota bacterium]
MDNDTIEVRLDERFEEGRLADYLRDKLPGAENPLQVRQFGGGAANLTYLLDFGTHEYVLRRPPLGPVAKSAHDMAREYKVLSVLHQALPSAPKAFLYCDDVDVIGADFFVMERLHGVVVRKSMPETFAGMPDAARRMSGALVDALAAFHAVDYEAIGLGDLGRPDGFLARQIDGWYRRWNHAKIEDLDEMDRLHRWLQDNLPATSMFSLVHNDYKLDNVMFAEDDPGHVVGIFDWDMCTLGDPLSDLGALLCYWSEPTDPAYYRAMAMMPTEDMGFMTRDELVARYEVVNGRSLTNINFYHALGLFRVSVIIAQIFIRFHRGQTQDKRFAAFGRMIPLMAKVGLEVARG